MKYCIIITTCPDNKKAKKLALKMLKRKIAACVQLSPIQSYYTWEKKVCNDPEIRVLIKTKSNLFKAVKKFIEKHHGYDVPQIVKIPIEDGSKKYLNWIQEEACKK